MPQRPNIVARQRSQCTHKHSRWGFALIIGNFAQKNMKIFNWVHKRLHHKDGFSGSVKKTELEMETNDKGTQAFLKQVGLVDVDGLDGWREGILTIGTLGFNPLKSFNQNEYFVLESEEDDQENNGFPHSDNDDDNDEHYDDNFGDEELNPLMFKTFGHSFEDVGSNSDAIEKPADDDHAILTVGGVPLTPFEGSHYEISIASPDLYCSEITDEDQRKKRGQRITLADLFQADHVHDVGQLNLDSCKVQPEMQKKVNVGTKSGLAFAKKLIPRVKEDSSPIKNLQRLMRRMLKRKIHPAELDVNVHKSDGLKQSRAVELITNVESDASDSVSLLPIQGATACVH
ncbi:hypothetical protein D8674_032411 [Pyrus ussuriensis x Pyrus communis]|uniref:Protein TILLER ANGLE CONTROL 1 n=1 Tax=Pyrus ussuriensis x Pyrus communis TaxID=2448454 RepID=A0A5N5F4A3_9ROSA|nr:hypothetical protein D8674_032411 [Pyrus ussuriensis x Pyrus communis]